MLVQSLGMHSGAAVRFGDGCVHACQYLFHIVSLPIAKPLGVEIVLVPSWKYRNARLLLQPGLLRKKKAGTACWQSIAASIPI